MNSLADLLRRLENVIRFGCIAEVDYASARCRVKSGQLLSTWLPWVTQRAGLTRNWAPPTIGEQCVLLCPGGELAHAVAVIGLYADAAPAPSTSASVTCATFPDGATFSYDHTTHQLTISLPSAGAAHLSAPAGIQIDGDVSVTGSVTASVEVTANGIALTTHQHEKVQSGNSVSGGPL
jgi:phage baseplate assembly protein V